MKSSMNNTNNKQTNSNNINSSGDEQQNIDRHTAKRNSEFTKYHEEIRRISSFHKDLMTNNSKMSKFQMENSNSHSSSKHKSRTILQRTLTKLNRKRRRLRSKINESLKSWDDMEYAERQNTVGTLDLFKYAQLREQLAVGFGILFMWYAASWQPISVFILAIMASLMGQYSKQVGWLQQLNNTTTTNNNNFTFGGLTVGNPSPAPAPSPAGSSILPSSFIQPPNLNDPQHNDSLNHHMITSSSFNQPAHKSYEGFSFLAPLYSFVTPIFDFGLDEKLDNEENIKAAINDIMKHESNQFLRKSFEINGSAFILALTQLTSFFIGMTLITWAAKKQASRVKILYFKSCLQQEVTWFEAIDSASGSGSSLNALVEKYEDGIGIKLALLCYFIGHVALFSLTAFYQMFKLAAFCMPFVLIVGFIITYLSDWQAIAIGQQALFAKRSLQLAEEIIAAIRTVFAFNGQQKEITRYSISLQPVYRKSLIKHLYTALNTSLSKFSIFACFAAYCFYAMRLFPPYHDEPINKATVLAVMRGAEVSIVNILISIPFMEALQQSKGSIARIYAAIERRSKIDPSSEAGMKPTDSKSNQNWQPSISFRMVQFGYADRSGPTSRRRSTLPFLNLPGSPGSQQAPGSLISTSMANSTVVAKAEPNLGRRRQSLIDELADELEIQRAARNPNVIGLGGHSNNITKEHNSAQPNYGSTTTTTALATTTTPAGGNNVVVTSNRTSTGHSHRRPSQAIKRMIGGEIDINKSNKRILNYFNLEIKAGQSVALVGPSGSGKSTVLALIQRLYDITGGQLLIGQHSIKDLNVGWLRNQIGVVTQEPRLFDMSIAENIRLGLCEDDIYANKKQEQTSAINGSNKDNKGASFRLNENDNNTSIMQQVIEAARAAGAHDFISRLPEGYNTRVGSGGVQLSGGQKQRIAIARALIRKPKILLLDESTSALDTESEAQVQKALNAASVGRTTLTVAHRLSTIKHVDLIVVMYQGQVVECGTHNELMSRQSSPETGPAIYKQMYEDQQAALSDSSDGCVKSEDDKRGETAQSGGQAKEGEESDKKKSRDRQGAQISELNASDLKKAKPMNRIEFDSFKECEIDNVDDDEEDDEYDVYDEDDDSTDDDFSSSYGGSSSTLDRERAGIFQLWHFIEMPKWSSMAAVMICLLAGLILPMNLIAHSYLFSAFAYSELDQIGDYLHVFGLVILSFSTFVFIVSFLQVILPGYVGEKLSIRMRVKTMDSLLSKPMFYFDMDSNSAGALCDRFNSYISNIQSIAGTRIATMLEAISTLAAGAFFGFGQNLSLSLFCLSFALLVLFTTIIESRIVQRESSLQQKFDAQLAHLMADALSNIKTIASLNKETFFINKFKDIIKQREVGTGFCIVSLRTFLTSLKFVMPAMSWSASMYYGCHLLVEGRIDLQTIFICTQSNMVALNSALELINESLVHLFSWLNLDGSLMDMQTNLAHLTSSVCPVVLFAVNDTFRALVFLPELLKARKSIERLYRMNREFSPQVLQTLTLGQQLEQQNQLHLEQLAAISGSLPVFTTTAAPDEDGQRAQYQLQDKPRSGSLGQSSPFPDKRAEQNRLSVSDSSESPPQAARTRQKKSISFVEPIKGASELVCTEPDSTTKQSDYQQQQQYDEDGNQIIVNRRLSNINNLPSYMRRKSSRLNSLIPRQQARGRIEFREVEFAYPNRPSALVLDGFSLNVAPGESVALVGGSGSGKSTCVSILEKFYDYHAGRITLDGYDLRLVESNWTRSQIGLVSQEPTLLSYTIGDNIRYGDNSRFVSMDEVVEAARTANIHDFIMSLPDQYDTELSSSAYSSSQLSGGQRQRIAIARALIRNAPILIFDEATSALDSRNESVVQDALNKARRGRTNLTIAHRLATIKDADKIAVLKDGKVVEVGRHEELIQNPDGHYRRLWERQEGALGASVETALTSAHDEQVSKVENEQDKELITDSNEQTSKEL